MYKSVELALTPKERGEFKKLPKWDVAEWDNSTWDASKENAVIEHQHLQLGLPTSGISTTPVFERAKFYALGPEQVGEGVVLVIDRNLCKGLGISEFIVAEYTRNPAVPEDHEVILVSESGAPLPVEVVSEVVKVYA